MVQTTTTLDVADNSGAKKIMCIRVLGGTKRKYASLGDVIVVSIKEAIPNAKVKKGDVAKAVIVRTKKEVSRQDGSYIRFDTNSAVLVDKDNEPVGTRIFGPVARELRASILEKEGSVEVSNVALWCGKCVAPRRARHDGIGEHKKRVCTKCGTAFETA